MHWNLFILKVGFNYLFEVPHNKGISTADFWNKGVDWIFDTFFVYIKAFQYMAHSGGASTDEGFIFKDASCSNYST